jgi:hypothetical protein
MRHAFRIRQANHRKLGPEVRSRKPTAQQQSLLLVDPFRIAVGHEIQSDAVLEEGLESTRPP